MKLQTLKPRLQAQRTPRQNNWGSGRGGRPWRRLKAKIHLRDKYTCQCCGVVTMELELDHIINIAQGFLNGVCRHELGFGLGSQSLAVSKWRMSP